MSFSHIYCQEEDETSLKQKIKRAKEIQVHKVQTNFVEIVHHHPSRDLMLAFPAGFRCGLLKRWDEVVRGWNGCKVSRKIGKRGCKVSRKMGKRSLLLEK